VQEELINVGQKQAALLSLHEIVTSRRNRQWTKVLEEVMFKYVELCVELKKGRLCKDGLMQYRNTCLLVNVQSLEEVVKRFLKLSTERAETAQAEFGATLDADVDLEAEFTPESLLAKAYRLDHENEATEKETVTPWFKFLWETYRNLLDILRNNNKLEGLYAMVVKDVFKFCLKHKRTTEFRRACDLMRTHLNNMVKYKDMRDRPDLSLPETQNLYMEVRFEQLKAATTLEMWQEAFRSIEDIHGLMLLLRRSPKPQMMALYFAKLTEIFWIGKNYLHAAYAWMKLYSVSKTYNRSLTPEDERALASGVVLATMCITPYTEKSVFGDMDSDHQFDRDSRMASLLGYHIDRSRSISDVLSRELLAAEIKRSGLLAKVDDDVKRLYALMEQSFSPLDLCKKADVLFNVLQGTTIEVSEASPVSSFDFNSFLPRLRSLGIIRMVHQQSKVFETMKIDSLKSSVPFMPYHEVERILVQAIRSDYISVRIDHETGSMNFVGDRLETGFVKTHLSRAARLLQEGMSKLAPKTPADVGARVLGAELRAAIEAEHKRALARKVVIERRKEEAERAAAEQEKEEEAKRVAAQRKHEENEAKRLEQEARAREEKRIRAEMEEKEKQEALELLAEQAKRAGKKAPIVLEEGVVLDKRAIMQDAIQEQIKARQEQERKLNSLAKRMDHVERAKREESISLIEKAYKERSVDDEKYHAEQQVAMAAKHRAKWEAESAEKQRLMRMEGPRAEFARGVMIRRAEQFAAQEEERARKLEQMKKHKEAERLLQAKKDYIKRLQEIEAAVKHEKREKDRIAQAERRRQQEEEEAARRQREQPPARGGDDRWGAFAGSAFGERRRVDEAPARPPSGGSRWEPSRGGDRYEPRRDDGRGGGFGDRDRAPSNRWERGGGDRPPSRSGDDRPPSRSGGADDGKYRPPRRDDAPSRGGGW
jgi:translation initiation factor 3 subunit A